jgi:hypothetical protein
VQQVRPEETVLDLHGLDYVENDVFIVSRKTPLMLVATSSKFYGRKRRKPRESERTGGSSVVEIPNFPLGSASRTPYRPLACVAID